MDFLDEGGTKKLEMICVGHIGGEAIPGDDILPLLKGELPRHLFPNGMSAFLAPLTMVEVVLELKDQHQEHLWTKLLLLCRSLTLLL